jgi:hypothetical protein
MGWACSDDDDEEDDDEDNEMVEDAFANSHIL